MAPEGDFFTRLIFFFYLYKMSLLFLLIHRSFYLYLLLEVSTLWLCPYSSLFLLEKDIFTR